MIVSVLTVLLFLAGVYAATILFFNRVESSEFTKKRIFEFDLNSGLTASEIGPGDTLSINPYIHNSSTEEMYVFIKIKMPKHNGDFLYSFDVTENWTLVEEEDEGIVYAYGVEEPIKLVPGDETEELTDSITLVSSTRDYPSTASLLFLLFLVWWLATILCFPRKQGEKEH